MSEGDTDLGNITGHDPIRRHAGLPCSFYNCRRKCAVHEKPIETGLTGFQPSFAVPFFGLGSQFEHIAQHQGAARKAGVAVSEDEVRSAVIDGALLRVRPIMMTVATIIAGLMPIMLGSGAGSEVMRRIAAPMVGGMVSATLLTLVVIPAVFLLWKQRTLAGRQPSQHTCSPA